MKALDALCERYLRLRAEIHAAARACGRDGSEVRLLVACKHQPARALMALWDAGARDFGDNQAQQLVEHRRALTDAARPARWHFFGRLQANKAACVARSADEVHSLDRAVLLPRLAQVDRAMPLPIFLQVNVGDEPQKGGVSPQALPELLQGALAFARLRPVGLMAVPPAGCPPAPHFARLAALAASLSWPAGPPQLSMGMSGDWPEAVAAGATSVRLGSALFGPRQVASLASRAGAS